MVETNTQKFIKHFKTGGLFYAIRRGFGYMAWRNRCNRMGIDWRKFRR